jgi:catechol 2,3-dioxygenase-like lactoylglutathione lyase family enzyme
MIDVLRVGHATFTTPDLERQVAYYSDVLGLIVTERDKNRAFLATRTGLEAIALERGDKPELTRLSFQVAADADFAAYARELSGHAGAHLHRHQGNDDRALFRLRVRQG